MGFLQHLLSSIKMMRLRGQARRYRSLILMGISLGVLGYELWEHRLEVATGIMPGTILEILVFGLVIPITAMMLGQLDRKVIQQDHTLHNFQHLHELESKIADIQDWEQLVLALVSFPSTIAPVSRAVLLVYDADQDRFISSGQYGASPNSTSDLTNPLPADFNPNCRLTSSSNGGPIYCSCLRQGTSSRSGTEQNQYCLPLCQGNTLVGMLHLYLPAGVTITPDQASMMTFFAPSIVMAINAMGHINQEIAHAVIVEDERRQVARYIHDTLGHNLGYLRLKLDQMASEVEDLDLTLLRQDMKRMSDVANLAYWQMRMSLASLNTKHPTDLVEALRTNLQITKEHGRLDTRFVVYGQPRRVSDFIQRRVLLIVNEILANLEQHSNPWKVELVMVWEDNQISISITDDGQAFVPGVRASLPGHFGLRIIQECTSEINGHLAYESIPEIGNRVTLRFPLLTSPPAKQRNGLLSNGPRQERSHEYHDR
jgi:nitrate/nitrite-specific signal transduction histidine kinase